MHGHAYTVGTRLLRIGRRTPPPARRWSRWLHEQGRDVVLSGLYSERPGADTLALLLHGCGGTTDSDYMVNHARHLFDAGVSVLRLAWRGADMLGEDLYHAAQTADIHGALSDPALAHYRKVWLLGFSLGGHACLHAAHEAQDARLTAVAAICPVLHLVQTNLAIDHPSRAFYRKYTLSGLRESYRALALRARAPTPFAHVRKARTFREYDALTVVPRYGFASVDDYYTSRCASRIVGSITRPTLVLSTRHDPILPSAIAEQVAPSFAPAVTFRMSERGGHLLFPRDLDLGEQAPLGIEAQVHAWLARQGDAR